MSAQDLQPGQFPLFTLDGRTVYPGLEMQKFMVRMQELTGGLDSTTSTTDALSAAATQVFENVAVIQTPSNDLETV